MIGVLKETDASRADTLEKLNASKAEVTKYTAMVNVAMDKVNEREDALRAQGITDDAAIQADPTYQKFYTAWRDHSSTLKQVQAKVGILQSQFDLLDKKYKESKKLREQILDNIQKIKDKAATAKEGLISANVLKRIEALERGLSITGAGKEIAMLDQISKDAQAEVRVRQDTATTSKEDATEELENYAQDAIAKDEFEAARRLRRQQSMPASKVPAASEQQKIRVDLGGPGTPV
jgi:hypothetical protein